MVRCPSCSSASIEVSEETLDEGYPVKVVKCAACSAVLGAMLPDSVVDMIRSIYQRISAS